MLAAILSRTGVLSLPGDRASDVPRFEALVKAHGATLQRLTVGYEASAEARRDLHQEILVALWRALPSFEGRSSLKTWVLRIAHNIGVSHVLRARRRGSGAWRSLEELGEVASSADEGTARLSRIRVDELAHAVRQLAPLDRQLVLLFLEGFSSSEIAAVTGLSDTNASTKLSRLRAGLRGRLQERHRNE